MLLKGLLGRIGEKRICGWVPQVEVLAQKAIGRFVSHYRWNSILESLWYGVPNVTWPMYAKQRLSAFMMVKEMGLAVESRLDFRSNGNLVMAEEIEKALHWHFSAVDLTHLAASTARVRITYGSAGDPIQSSQIVVKFPRLINGTAQSMTEGRL
ncbi:hypothetical protein SLEP1_g27804 [Rubroshorea leprosula]|uniref:Uncharacterized protein n=1 Tax=Rubroshorea leprosula TaxID=152421 RepID=A0AAV5K474_9ROSI|nr:hypothetical protein SLEP1_g27804 [Rubroshorea leprosula]